MVIGPKFARNTSQSEIVQNFLFGIKALIRGKKLNSSSPFAEGAVQLLSAQVDSGGLASLDPKKLSFLEQAGPGLEATIANALQAALN